MTSIREALELPLRSMSLTKAFLIVVHIPPYFVRSCEELSGLSGTEVFASCSGMFGSECSNG